MRTLIISLLLLLGACKMSGNGGIAPTKTYKDTTITFPLSGGTYYLPIMVIISSDIPVVVNLTRQLMGDSSINEKDFDKSGLTLIRNDGATIVWLPTLPRTTEQFATANHELLHLTFSIMRWAGITLSENSEEAFTYEFQFISKQFYEEVLK